jgi:hypothetical protein
MSAETPDDEYIPGLDNTSITPEVDNPTRDTIVAPPQNESTVIPNEFIVIKNKERILPYVEPQWPKENHFKFKNIKDQEALANVLAPKDSGFIAVFSTTRDKPHITLWRGTFKDDKKIKIEGTKEGKIHFLYHDKNKPENKYIKLYLFDFTDNAFHSDIKSKLINFFENFTPVAPVANLPQQGGKKKRRTVKRRHAKRKTNRRNKY